ncbi:uncharacterized protein LOC106877552 isoform X1 [Octopus bimaculoides]|nr:uncharacterized protein LOC106877552 isoform X1 [Octopus bimaculoides]XP_014781970.1 uncharacterized protein LOC106877552 isoform X1 [Octopus bimaculoides]|eukprot:XP_014781969.1 PREDICTED: uncharacterized protein LOC106877552 isoform X1 [Octopus bimaculoides]
MLEHRPAKIAVIVVTLIIFIVTAVLNAYASQPDSSSGIYTTSIRNVSNVYATGFSPANWTFNLWYAVYMWTAAWLLFCVSTICTVSGNSYLYLEPDVFPSKFYLIFAVTLCLNISWFILYDRSFFIASFFVALTMTVFSFTTLGISIYYLYLYANTLIKNSFGTQACLIQLLVHNGIAFFGTWVTLLMHMNLDIALHYRWEVSRYISDLVPLCILVVLIVTWFTLDIAIFDTFTRYLLSPYVMLVIVFSGVVHKQVDVNSIDRIGIVVLVMLILSSVTLVTKFLFMIWRHFNGPQTSLSV